MTSIRIERLPKLDKVLRVTFSAIKRDLKELREEYGVLEEKVASSLDVFKQRQKNDHGILTKNTKEKLTELKQNIDLVNKEFNSELSTLVKSVDKFINKTDQKTSSWDKKIRTLEINVIRAKEIGQDLKEVKKIISELDKIKILKKEIEAIKELTVLKKQHDFDIKQLKKDQEKSQNKTTVNINLLTTNLEKSISSQSTKFSKMFRELENKTEIFVKSSELNSIKNELSELKKKKELESKDQKKEKEFFNKNLTEIKKSIVDIKNEQDGDLKEKSSNLIKDVEHIKNELKDINYLKKNMDSLIKNNENLKSKLYLLEKENKTLEVKLKNSDNEKELKELKKLVNTLYKEVKVNSSKRKTKELDSLIKKSQEETKSFLNQKESVKNKRSLQEIEINLPENKKESKKSKKEKILVKEIENSLDDNLNIDLKEKIKEKSEELKDVEIKTKAENKKEIKKEKRKGGFFKKFLDFLIEDVEEEKDMKIHEFDKKKGEKFEIKEIKNMDK